ncbi:MAG: cache domain-containing protein [Gemmatimonadota bacterium]|nr:cache domain-containing protein [Gemmatimonadota bacterium]
MIRSVSVLLCLLVLAGTPPPRPAHAQVEKVTAGEVVDGETLRKFVLWAESVFSRIHDMDEGSRLLEEVRTEAGDYNAGNMYVILFTLKGRVFIHGEDPDTDRKNAVNVRDDAGTLVVQEMLSTGAEEGGGFVEWCWDDPADPEDVLCKQAYAIRYHSPVADREFVLVGGYYQDLTRD